MRTVVVTTVMLGLVRVGVLVLVTIIVRVIAMVRVRLKHLQIRNPHTTLTSEVLCA